MAEIDYSDIEDWVQTELYQELLKMPLWTASAFEKDGAFYCDEIRLRLLTNVIGACVRKYPKPYDNIIGQYIYNFKTDKYMPLLRQVWGISYSNIHPVANVST